MKPASAEKIILAIDCGTQSLRAMLFSSHGRLLAKNQQFYDPYFSSREGWAEQDPELFWNTLCRSCRTLKNEHPDWFRSIQGVGVTTVRNSMVNVDENGIPLRPVICWLDQRKATPVFKPSLFTRLAHYITGMNEAVHIVQQDAKCNWIREHQPQIWQKTYKYLQISGFLNFRLTGQFKDSIASQIGHIPFHYKKQLWAKPWNLNAKLFPIEPEKLVDIVPPGTLIGSITKEASALTTIRKGTPVFACGSDKGCETIGMGVTGGDQANLSFGTAATVQTTSPHYFEPVRFMPAYPAARPGFFNPGVELFRGYWMVNWFKNEFAYKEVLEAKKKGISAESVLNTLLTEAPPGANGLMVQPFWGPGLKTPDAKGAMIGFGSIHKKPHIYRAVIEGLNYGLLNGMHAIEKAGKQKIRLLSVSGGGSQSDEICQIAADIFNLELVRGETWETAGLGAAMVTAVGTTIHPSFSTASKKMIRYDRAFKPEPANVDLYRELYHQVYKKMYRSLSPLYRKIRKITGYPAYHHQKPESE